MVNQLVTFKNYTNNPSTVTNHANLTNNNSKNTPTTTEAYLKQAVYTENVSRQSSIRSLLSNISETSNPLKPVNPQTSNSKETSKHGASYFYSNGDLNYNKSESHAQFAAKMKQTKVKAAANTPQTAHLATLMPVTKKEVELLNDWDTFRPSPVKIINTSTHHYSGPSGNLVALNNGSNVARPQTRLGLRDDQERGTLMDSSSNFLSSNNVNSNRATEYSDNVTVASSSSTSSGRYYQEDGEEGCESVLVTPTNEKEYYFNNGVEVASRKVESKDLDLVSQRTATSLTKKNSIGNETVSVLSDFAVNILNFEDNQALTNQVNQNGERKSSKGKINLLFLDLPHGVVLLLYLSKEGFTPSGLSFVYAEVKSIL